MKYTFKELVDVPKLQELTDELYTATSIPSAIVAMDGEIITGSGWQKICTDFHRKHPQIEKECIESDTIIRKKLDDGEPFVIYKCPRGLVDASSPIIIAGEHVANVFSGQVFLESCDETTEQFFREQARKFGFNETEYIKAFKGIPVFEEKKFRAGIAFLSKLAQSIADTGLNRLRELEAMEALRESEEKFRALAENQHDVVWTVNENLEVDYISPSCFKMTGTTAEETIGKNPNEFYTEESYQRVIMKLAEERQKSANDMQPVVLEVDQYHEDGHLFPVEITCIPVIIDNKFVGVQGITRDITERKKAEKALRESEELHKEAQRVAHIGHWELYPEIGTPVWSDEIFRIFSLNPQEREPSFTDHETHLHPDDWPLLNKAVTLASTEGARFDIIFRIVRPDGEIRWMHSIGTTTKDEKGKVTKLFGTAQDITDLKRTEEEKNKLETQLHRAQKMEAMGLMAGGVAHDLNNILSGIVSYPELLLMDLPENSPLRNPIKTIQESGMRAADVVEDLLTIARGVASGKEVLNLNTVVKEYLVSAEQQKLEKMKPLNTYRTALDSELLNITCSASHVKKILMNLVANASEAIEGRGTVTVSTMNRYLDEPLRGYEDVRIGEYVLLSVSDDGSGIFPQDLDKIFEPFYTKKVMGRSGTGLGLAVVWNSMRDHNGYINVKSNEKGTVFELYFPTTREEVTAEAEEVPLEDYLGHGEKILVVDDEERQREIAGGILTRLGYSAESVSSGEEAVEYVKEHPVDLIVLDMVMPKGINGRKTYKEIIKIRPGQKAIIASGFAKTKEVDKTQELGAGKYIKKPYTLAKVGLAVKEELEK